MQARSYSHVLAAVLSMVVLGRAVAPASATSLSWDGGGDGQDWFDADNWDPNSVPATGDDVTVDGSASVLLTNTTDYLNTFVISNATLTFTNWTTWLRATNVTVAKSGTLTHTANSALDTNAIGGWDGDGGIFVDCTNFSLLADGLLDADQKGYKGGTTAHRAGYGPGGGVYGSVRGSGGSHGGVGGKGNATGVSTTYGLTNAPADPGSGGGSKSSPSSGGDGGGYVRIKAGGHVLINGTITADGEGGGDDSGGGGSGGGVYISCRTFEGTTGRIGADAGNGTAWGGGGGGGRIAVRYNAAAQQALGVPAGVRLSVRHGGAAAGRRTATSGPCT